MPNRSISEYLILSAIISAILFIWWLLVKLIEYGEEKRWWGYEARMDARRKRFAEKENKISYKQYIEENHGSLDEFYNLPQKQREIIFKRYSALQ